MQMDYIGLIMLQDPESFKDQKLTFIYVARRLREARAAEEVLDTGLIDYEEIFMYGRRFCLFAVFLLNVNAFLRVKSGCVLYWRPKSWA